VTNKNRLPKKVKPLCSNTWTCDRATLNMHIRIFFSSFDRQRKNFGYDFTKEAFIKGADDKKRMKNI